MDPITLGIVSVIDSITKLVTVIIQSQTPEQQKILWDRYIQETAPFHALLMKLQNLPPT